MGHVGCGQAEVTSVRRGTRSQSWLPLLCSTAASSPALWEQACLFCRWSSSWGSSIPLSQSQPLTASSFVFCGLPYGKKACFQSSVFISAQSNDEIPLPLTTSLTSLCVTEIISVETRVCVEATQLMCTGVDALLSRWVAQTSPEVQSRWCPSS